MKRTRQKKDSLPQTACLHAKASRTAHTCADGHHHGRIHSYDDRRESCFLLCVGLLLLLAAPAIPLVHVLVALARDHMQQHIHIIGGAGWPTFALLYRQALRHTFLGPPWPFLCLHTGTGVLLVAAILRRKTP